MQLHTNGFLAVSTISILMALLSWRDRAYIHMSTSFTKYMKKERTLSCLSGAWLWRWFSLTYPYSLRVFRFILSQTRRRELSNHLTQIRSSLSLPPPSRLVSNVPNGYNIYRAGVWREPLVNTYNALMREH